MIDLATLYRDQGRLTDARRMYDQAEKLIDRSIAAQEKIYGPAHHFMASSWMTKARICKAKGDHKQARELIDRALGAVQKTGNARLCYECGAVYPKLTALHIFTTSSIWPTSWTRTTETCAEAHIATVAAVPNIRSGGFSLPVIWPMNLFRLAPTSTG